MAKRHAPHAITDALQGRGGWQNTDFKEAARVHRSKPHTLYDEAKVPYSYMAREPWM
jgi:hypothetical protein